MLVLHGRGDLAESMVVIEVYVWEV